MAAENPAPGSKSERSFVVLFHRHPAGDHFDLMIEAGERLATWKMMEPPETAVAQPVCCRRIGDHRRIYLDYEGPVSGNRGDVSRYDRGQCTVYQEVSNRWEATFDGKRLVGVFSLERSDQGAELWLFRSLSPRSPNG